MDKNTGKHRLGTHSSQVAVTIDGGELGFTYVGPLSLGQAGTVLDVVYDTGSDWLAVEGSDCTSCEGDTFDGTASGVRLEPTQSERLYGSVGLTGYVYSDRVCIDNTACVNDFEYFLISSQVGINGYTGLMEPVDGILGMSRDIVPPEYDYEIGPLFVKALSYAGYTQYNVFSFYLEGPGDVSFIDFNGFMQDHIKDANDSKITWLKLKDDFYWASYCQGISFGRPGLSDSEMDSPNAFGFTGGVEVFSVFDTGTSFSLLPPSFWQSFTDTLVSVSGIPEGTYQITDGFFAFVCDDAPALVDLYFMLDTYWYQMSK